MDRAVIDEKLESLRRCLSRVCETCPRAPGELSASADMQDIVTLNLTRAVQLAVDIGAHWLAQRELSPPDTMGQTFDRLEEAGLLDGELASRMKKAVGFRDLAVHNYHEIDWEIVHAICTKRLTDFDDFARAVAGSY